MSLLDANPNSKDYYTVRTAVIDKKTAARRYTYTPALLLDGMGAMQFAERAPRAMPGKTIETVLMIYDYGKHAWLPVPGFGR